MATATFTPRVFNLCKRLDIAPKLLDLFACYLYVPSEFDSGSGQILLQTV
jgi:hypothetical protein